MADVDVVTMVATKSSNLKGGYVRALKDAARSIAAIIDTIALRPSGDEQARLEKINEGLVRANGELKTELATLRGKVLELKESLRELKETGKKTPSSTFPRITTFERDGSLR